MNYYFAPMEGITGRIYRNTFREIFDKDNLISKYYSPFIVYHEKCNLSDKDIKDVHPDNNRGLKLVPQVLTNKAFEYLELEKFLRGFGYDEININVGCPSKTVFSKKRGAGLLTAPDMLDEMLYGIFEKCEAKVSVKTRVGVDNAQEFYDILDIYNKYKLSELIIHPRVQKQFYQGETDVEIYRYALDNTSIKLCYNGNLFSKEDVSKVADIADTVMLGRGLLRHPSIIREMEGGSIYSNQELSEFLGLLMERYSSEFSGDIPVLYKLKEIWSYLKEEFPDNSKELKKLFKSKSLAEYLVYERAILR